MSDKSKAENQAGSCSKSAANIVMCNAAKSQHRGHKMYYDEKLEVWRYEDDDTPVPENWKNRTCNKCGEYFTEHGHDPCIANLPNVQNACCGHGDNSLAYIQFEDGQSKRGKEAINAFKKKLST